MTTPIDVKVLLMRHGNQTDMLHTVAPQPQSVDLLLGVRSNPMGPNPEISSGYFSVLRTSFRSGTVQ